MMKTKHVVHVSTLGSTACEHCSFHIGGSEPDAFADSVNHYISKHGYRVLHVGTETDRGPKGEPWHGTVAVLGTSKKPPSRKVAVTPPHLLPGQSPRPGR